MVCLYTCTCVCMYIYVKYSCVCMYIYRVSHSGGHGGAPPHPMIFFENSPHQNQCPLHGAPPPTRVSHSRGGHGGAPPHLMIFFENPPPTKTKAPPWHVPPI